MDFQKYILKSATNKYISIHPAYGATSAPIGKLYQLPKLFLVKSTSSVPI